MPEPYDFAKRCLDLAKEGVPVTDAWHKRLHEHPVQFPSFKGRVFKDDADPKRGAESPLGGKVW